MSVSQGGTQDADGRCRMKLAICGMTGIFPQVMMRILKISRLVHPLVTG
jgi:hypothetical protein